MAKKPAPSGKPDRGRIPPEDAILWERVTRGATPLARGKNRKSQDIPGEAPNEPLPPPRPAPPRAAAPPKREPPRPAPARYDPREAKRLAAGRMAVDARIDLHGMRQSEAHAVLKSFLAQSRARGHRHVLVITGKGAARSRAAPESFIDSALETGVLRRALPQWLDGEALREIVVGYAQAGPRHGGAGAFYVRLRKPGR